MYTTGETVGLAEWIIHDTCLEITIDPSSHVWLLFLYMVSKKQNKNRAWWVTVPIRERQIFTARYRRSDLATI